jgi:hypothetical protein
VTPELQAQLAAYLKALMDTSATAANFAKDQLPLVVQEKILYGRVSETLQLVLCLAVVYASARVVRWGLKEERKSCGDFGIAGIVGGGIVGVLFTIFTMIQLNYVVMVWTAPRLYIIEWAAKLASGK